MDLNLNKYIVPISTWGEKGESAGVGILVGNLFMTAGHVVIEHEFITFKIEKLEYKFTKEQAYLIRLPNKDISSLDYDICIFQIEEITSPFLLSEELPVKDQHLTSVSYKQHIVRKISDVLENVGFLDKFLSQEEIIDMRFSEGVVVEIENNFFFCKMSVPLEPGRSGSPIILDNKVFGILIGGKEKGNFCGYLSSKSILDYIKINQCLM